MNGPLKGIRVIALSQYIAGPYGSMLLGDMGAEVIKIEPPAPTANRILPGPNFKGESFYHLAFNRSKKSVTLDLRTKSGHEAFRELLNISDVIWSNYRPASIKNIGADYETVKKINPKIVCCCISGYGMDGPYRDRPAFDINGLAMSGVMSVTGEPEGGPLRPGVPMGDYVTGMLSALGVCSALVQREKTRQGQMVDISLLDSCLATMSYDFTYMFCGGGLPERMGNGHTFLHPYNAYQTKDGWITIGPSWPGLAKVLKLDRMIDDPRFSTLDERVKHRKEFDRIVQEKLSEKPTAEWMELMNAADVSAAPVNTIDKTAADPQVKHRKMVVELDHSLGGKIKMTGNPVKMPGSIDDRDYLPPPTLGQHNEEILGGLLKYSPEKIEGILRDGRQHSEELKKHLHKRM